MNKIILLALLNIYGAHSLAQGVFTYKPQNPKAGDIITFSYTLPDNYFYTPEAYVVKYIKTREYLFDVPLIKKGNTYTGSITTDSSMNLFVFSFKNAGKWDNNSNNGFFVYLYNSNQVKNFAYLNTAHFLDFYGSYRLGLKKNDSAVACNFEKEFSFYPANRDRNFTSYLRVLSRLDKSKTNNLAEIEIDRMIKKGLETRQDYDNIQTIYSIINQPEKSEFYKKLSTEKIPFDKYNIDDLRKILQQEKNISAKEKLLEEFTIEKKQNSSKINYSSLIATVTYNLANDYIENKKWDALKNILNSITPPSAFLYSKASKRAMLDSGTLDYARFFAKQAVSISKNDWVNPGEVPNVMTYNEIVRENKNSYGFYTDNYAQILLTSKMYTEAFLYAKDAALIIEDGNNVQYNSHYATIVSKTLPLENFKPQLEKFVRDGKENDNIISILKEAYILRGNDTLKFNAYINKLKNEANAQLVKQIKTQRINSQAISFDLKDINGNVARLNDYKGKIVILDFWATWCAPCVASFPAMNELVQQYKRDTSVVFLFINTLQNEDDKVKSVKDFIMKNKYDFNVLLDTENKIAKLYDITNIPIKIIIGKDGKIKFKTIGFKGDELLKKELTAIISLVK